MINLANREIQKFISFISNSDIPPVELYIVPDFDSVETIDGQVGLACYVEGKNQIILPGDLTNELIFTCIAHEYYHHIEYCVGLKHDENKAEKFAEEMEDMWEKYSKFQQNLSSMFFYRRGVENENN